MTDYSPFFIMDAHLECKVHGALLLAIEMAKKSYPHLEAELQTVEQAYTKRLESFIGRQNKPTTKKAYGKA